MKHKIYLFSFAVLAFSAAYAQPQFTQQMFNRMNINPAFTGLKNTTAADTSDTKQLDIVVRTFTDYDAEYSMMATYQMPFGKKKKSGIGFMFNFNNEKGIEDLFGADALAPTPVTLYNQYAAKVYYSYALAPGFYIGASAGIVNLSQLINPLWYYSVDFDPPQNYTAPDFDFGMAYNWKSLFFGLSLGHFNSPGYYTYGDIPNYTGMSVNFTIGGNINIWKTRVVCMTSLYNYNIVDNLLFYPEKHIFIGASFTFITNFSPDGLWSSGGGNYYTSIMLGCDFFKGRLKISFSLDILPSNYYSYYPSAAPNTESWMGYTFK